jgi:hypothetical protein
LCLLSSIAANKAPRAKFESGLPHGLPPGLFSHGNARLVFGKKLLAGGGRFCIVFLH